MMRYSHFQNQFDPNKTFIIIVHGFFSISPLLRYWAARNTCPKCSYRWTNDLKHEVMKLRKVDFFWINREQRSFEWFISLLSQLEIEQAEQGGAMERFLDMHMYITSALQKTDMKAVGLQLALELLHEKVRSSFLM